MNAKKLLEYEEKHHSTLTEQYVEDNFIDYLDYVLSKVELEGCDPDD